MSATPKRRYTVSEYFERELDADQKNEFYDGEIFATAGASREHNFIVANLMRQIGNPLNGGPCVVLGSDMRVRLASGLYTYPDVTIVCGEREYAPENRDTLVNPTAVVEVLSPSTTNYDAGKKFRWYQQTPSIREIGFVWQTEPRFQLFRRGEPRWEYEEAASLEEAIHLRTGGVALPLAEVYRNVEFPDPGERR